uniref:Uncharacterized protein n=1 Tax=Arundo donax TaxID=35708 RepID=A0A0A8Y118_ARUDO
MVSSACLSTEEEGGGWRDLSEGGGIHVSVPRLGGGWSLWIGHIRPAWPRQRPRTGDLVTLFCLSLLLSEWVAEGWVWLHLPRIRWWPWDNDFNDGDLKGIFNGDGFEKRWRGVRPRSVLMEDVSGGEVVYHKLLDRRGFIQSENSHITGFRGAAPPCGGGLRATASCTCAWVVVVVVVGSLVLAFVPPCLL